MKYLVLDGDPEGELFTFDVLNEAVMCYLNHPNSKIFREFQRVVLDMVLEEYNYVKKNEPAAGHFQKY